MSRRTMLVTLAAVVAILLAVMLVFLANSDSGISPEDRKGTEFVEQTEGGAGEEQFPAADPVPEEKAEGIVPRENENYEFVLRNYHNYVTVYTLPEDTLYEYTDVILDVLPEETKEEIRQGKYLRNEEELYNFLENYTS